MPKPPSPQHLGQLELAERGATGRLLPPSDDAVGGAALALRGLITVASPSPRSVGGGATTARLRLGDGARLRNGVVAAHANVLVFRKWSSRPGSRPAAPSICMNSSRPRQPRLTSSCGWFGLSASQNARPRAACGAPPGHRLAVRLAGEHADEQLGELGTALTFRSARSRPCERSAASSATSVSTRWSGVAASMSMTGWQLLERLVELLDRPVVLQRVDRDVFEAVQPAEQQLDLAGRTRRHRHRRGERQRKVAPDRSTDGISTPHRLVLLRREHAGHQHEAPRRAAEVASSQSSPSVSRCAARPSPSHTSQGSMKSGSRPARREVAQRRQACRTSRASPDCSQRSGAAELLNFLQPERVEHAVGGDLETCLLALEVHRDRELLGLRGRLHVEAVEQAEQRPRPSKVSGAAIGGVSAP
jgi:hypothetical protein